MYRLKTDKLKAQDLLSNNFTHNANNKRCRISNGFLKLNKSTAHSSYIDLMELPFYFMFLLHKKTCLEMIAKSATSCTALIFSLYF